MSCEGLTVVLLLDTVVLAILVCFVYVIWVLLGYYTKLTKQQRELESVGCVTIL